MEDGEIVECRGPYEDTSLGSTEQASAREQSSSCELVDIVGHTCRLRVLKVNRQEEDAARVGGCVLLYTLVSPKMSRQVHDWTAGIRVEDPLPASEYLDRLQRDRRTKYAGDQIVLTLFGPVQAQKLENRAAHELSQAPASMKVVDRCKMGLHRSLHTPQVHPRISLLLA